MQLSTSIAGVSGTKQEKAAAKKNEISSGQ
jgi:hypothetical protein